MRDPANGHSATHGARAYPTVWRIIAALLVATSRASLVGVGIGLLAADQPVALAGLVRLLVVLSLLPGVAAWLIARAFTVDVSIQRSALTVDRRDLRIEIPCASIARVIPWIVPLPGPGLSLLLHSGRRFEYGIEVSDPIAFLADLADSGGVDSAPAAARHPIVAYAHARHGVTSRRWYHPLGKFVGFALVPTAVWFYAHQHIAYGGLLGQYYLEGLAAYLKTFVISWSLTAIYVLLYASTWRGVAETVALLAAWLAPARAVTARHTLEGVCGIAYYLGVPLLVLLPFLQ